MLPFGDHDSILMEYRPGASDSAYGRLVVLTGGNAYLVEDGEARKGGYDSGNDQLNPVWFDGDTISAYWRDCDSTTASDGTVQVLDTRTLTLSAWETSKLGSGGAYGDGPVFFADLMFPCLNESLFPHVGAGVVYGFADFEEESWWHLGYLSPAEYEATGRTYKTKNDRYREIQVDDSFGFVVQAGIAWRPIERLQLDVTLRQTFLSCDAEFGYRGKNGFHREMDGEFDLDNFALVAMASYVF